jgi:hypothetical protein
MTPAQQAKAAGLKNLKQVSIMIKKPSATLINWHRDSPELFAIVIAGCVAQINEGENNG